MTKIEVPFKHKKLRDIEDELFKVQLRNVELMKAQHKESGNIKVTCLDNHLYGKGCNKKIKIKELTYIQKHFYVSPYGCSGGDYWKEGEGFFICPHCGHLNRLYDRPDFQALRFSFKNIQDEYPNHYR